jgi:L-alanine-DL-glutamate epimerase-like enolase superfamily enzyme
MKITELETVVLDRFPNLVYVRLHTDEGLVGLGETFFTARTVAARMHEVAAPYLELPRLSGEYSARRCRKASSSVYLLSRCAAPV